MEGVEVTKDCGLKWPDCVRTMTPVMRMLSLACRYRCALWIGFTVGSGSVSHPQRKSHWQCQQGWCSSTERLRCVHFHHPSPTHGRPPHPRFGQSFAWATLHVPCGMFGLRCGRYTSCGLRVWYPPQLCGFPCWPGQPVPPRWLPIDTGIPCIARPTVCPSHPGSLLRCNTVSTWMRNSLLAKWCYRRIRRCAGVLFLAFKFHPS